MNEFRMAAVLPRLVPRLTLPPRPTHRLNDSCDAAHPMKCALREHVPTEHVPTEHAAPERAPRKRELAAQA
jgi:hypothetical protein